MVYRAQLCLISFCSILLVESTNPLGAATAKAHRPQEEVRKASLSIDDLRALQPGRLSPTLIEQYLRENENADLKEIFQIFQMSDTEISTDMSLVCHGDCDAKHWYIDIGESTAAVLKISLDLGSYCRYLVFKRIDGNQTERLWQFLGDFESGRQRYGSPGEKIETGADRTWFVINERWGSGSGVSLYGERWYELDGKPPKEVLSYPVSGGQMEFTDAPGREFNVSVKSHSLRNGVYGIELWFWVSYRLERDVPLFRKSQKAYYVWNSDKGEFVIDETQSEVSNEEIEAVYNIDSLNDEQFLKFNLTELTKLATAGTSEQKQWLNKFVNRLQDSLEKRNLLEAMK